MSLTDELERLQALHDSGTLTDTEFANAKAKVLTESRPSAAVANSSIQQDLRRLQIQNGVLQLDQQWAMEREDYMLRTRFGTSVIPSESRSFGGTVYMCAVSAVFAVIGANIPQGGFLIAAGLGGIIAGIWVGVSGCAKANAYEAAYEQYQRKRRDLTDQLAALS